MASLWTSPRKSPEETEIQPQEKRTKKTWERRSLTGLKSCGHMLFAEFPEGHCTGGGYI